MRRFCFGGIAALLSLGFISTAGAEIEDAVIRIVNQTRSFSWYTPWASGSTGSGTGTGFVIKGKKILTNAHVVSDSAMLIVYFHDDPTPYPAKISAIAHDCDLALLELKDPSRLDHVEPLEFDSLPQLRSRVVTYGYPAGGKLLSSTVGVVSRIEVQRYVHSGMDQHLTVQTDAAINPGNSGGPVIQNGKVVGVAFQGSKSLENMGFFIPINVVNHFLKDMENGTYDGYPELGLYAANLTNPASRRHAGMTDGESGVRVERFIKGCGAEQLLEPGDIITAIDGYDVANDGTVAWNGFRLEFPIVVEQLQKGDTVKLDIIRNGERKTVTVTLNHYNPFPAKSNIYDRQPTYFVYGGYVFVPVNFETVQTYSKDWVHEAPQELVYELYYRHLHEDQRLDAPQVMLIRRMDHEVNVEESLFTYKIIDTVNGQSVRTLEELIGAFETNTADQHIMRFQYGNRLIALDRNSAEAVNADILEKYAIPKDRNL